MLVKKGYVQDNVGAIIYLVIGVGVAVLVLIFVGVLGGQTYQLTQDKISAITDANIKGSITRSITSGFSALETVGSYLPIVVLAVIIFIVLGLVIGMGGSGGYGGGQGSAL